MIENQPKPIRSFVLRERRVARQNFPKSLLEHYCFNTRHASYVKDSLLSLSPLTLDIGFGNGEALFTQARLNPMQHYIGVEVYKTGINKLLSQLNKVPLSNIKLIQEDAFYLLSNAIPYNSLDNIQVLFPDPWPKRRHHKRRLIQPAFIQLLHHALKPGGKLYLSTDWEHYAYHMLDTVEKSAFKNITGAYRFIERPFHLPTTKFEERGKVLGHAIFYLAFTKCI